MSGVAFRPVAAACAASIGLITTGLLIVGSGTAVADTVVDRTRTVDTDDGWTLTVTKTAETLDRYPNLAATMFTREGFVSLKAIAEIGGKGDKPVSAGVVRFGYQIGCQIDVSSGLTTSLGFSAGPNASLNISYPPSVSLGVNASVSPNISTTLKPGSIATVEFGKKALASGRASIAMDQVEIKVDACMGPVSLRSFATATMSTPTADNTTTAYGDPIWL
ncbi:MspA family porin [Nocardia brasiliensis]|uniref:MspA family porin n=1 Tax=Nocardia brasiliensis TaxID=37326 RepID=UPI002454E3DA|nr:MspA family porin [Nocardia brasiliensis]